MVTAAEQLESVKNMVISLQPQLHKLKETAAEKDVQNAETQASLLEYTKANTTLQLAVDDLMKQVGSTKIEVNAKSPQEAELSNQLSLMKDSSEAEALQLISDEASAKVAPLHHNAILQNPLCTRVLCARMMLSSARWKK